MNVKEISDEMAADVRAHLGEAGLFAFANGVAMFEAVTRMTLAFDARPASAAVTVIDRLPRPARPVGSAA